MAKSGTPYIYMKRNEFELVIELLTASVVDLDRAELDSGLEPIARASSRSEAWHRRQFMDNLMRAYIKGGPGYKPRAACEFKGGGPRLMNYELTGETVLSVRSAKQSIDKRWDELSSVFIGPHKKGAVERIERQICETGVSTWDGFALLHPLIRVAQ